MSEVKRTVSEWKRDADTGIGDAQGEHLSRNIQSQKHWKDDFNSIGSGTRTELRPNPNQWERR